MSSIRQDAWTNDEDVLLAEVILRHIREGSTQLAAFEEVGERLSRTSAACGFRWNSLVRKQYESAISLAKKQRKEAKNNKEEKKTNEMKNAQERPKNVSVYRSLTIDSIIEFLRALQNSDEEREGLKNEINTLKTDNQKLQRELKKMENNYQSIQEDYKSLIEIMDRARKMVVLKDDDSSNLQFQMDYNGNLEKVKK
ncbi:RsfA family transcriptional regulator [Pseudalkalibacillus caeni]|uniref:RsfA family transcriptional regulator n=1 Tax=Exobacillus caeni TaxID=2574798 RepID=A0A5R9F5G0_9BACL|nr:RsfA family transcriptional regulator [Pseudalkalibacillus caeni]TLS37640.1 RsfA family transcriptional regulator [Pseudalkalibacillus caeni]